MAILWSYGKKLSYSSKRIKKNKQFMCIKSGMVLSKISEI